jgi:hypothetical protein
VVPGRPAEVKFELSPIEFEASYTLFIIVVLCKLAIVAHKPVIWDVSDKQLTTLGATSNLA